MSESGIKKHHIDQLFASDSPVMGVIAKKIRNKRKKYEKVCQKIAKAVSDKSKTHDPEDDLKRERLEGEIKELEEIKKAMKSEALNMGKTLATAAERDAVNDEATQKVVDNALGRVADALLINLLQNQYQVKDLLNEQQNAGLKAVLKPLEHMQTPPSGSVLYDRARDCFVHVYRSLAAGSDDIIPGTSIKFRELADVFDSIPESVRNSQHVLKKPEAPKARVEESKEETVVAQNIGSSQLPSHVDKLHSTEAAAPLGAGAPAPQQNDIWNQAAEDDEDEEGEAELKDEEIEKLAEEDALRENVKAPETHMGQKTFIDEDGFVHVKPHQRPAYEHKYIKGVGTRGGRKGRHGQQERWQVKGAKGGKAEHGLSARGGRGGRGRRGAAGSHHDKHDLDDTGRKTKTAHGKHPNWHKGEVRVSEGGQQ